MRELSGRGCRGTGARLEGLQEKRRGIRQQVQGLPAKKPREVRGAKIAGCRAACGFGPSVRQGLANNEGELLKAMKLAILHRGSEDRL